MDWIFALSLAVIFLAYFIKGFSGFGPALIVVPLISFLYDPVTAIFLSSIFDSIAGIILCITVIKNIPWKNVIPATVFILAGAYIGVRILALLPVELLQIIIAVIISCFIIVIYYENADRYQFVKKLKDKFVILFAGITGLIEGVTGAGGPILVTFLKLKYRKKEFRQLVILIFTFSALWRSLLYYLNDLIPVMTVDKIGIMIFILIIALFTGHRIQKDIDEIKFNKVVALILVIPVFLLLYKTLPIWMEF